MKSGIKSLLYQLMFLSLLMACSSSSSEEFSLDGTNISVKDIAGNWVATKAEFSRAAAGPSMNVDVVADGGSVNFQIQTDGRFSITVTVQGEAPETSTGRLGFDEDLLVISFDDDPEEFEFFGITHNEPNLFIQGGTVFEAFDFDGDGIDEDAFIDFQFVRN